MCRKYCSEQGNEAQSSDYRDGPWREAERITELDHSEITASQGCEQRNARYSAKMAWRKRSPRHFESELVAQGRLSSSAVLSVLKGVEVVQLLKCERV